MSPRVLKTSVERPGSGDGFFGQDRNNPPALAGLNWPVALAPLHITRPDQDGPRPSVAPPQASRGGGFQGGASGARPADCQDQARSLRLRATLAGAAGTGLPRAGRLSGTGQDGPGALPRYPSPLSLTAPASSPSGGGRGPSQRSGRIELHSDRCHLCIFLSSWRFALPLRGGKMHGGGRLGT